MYKKRGEKFMLKIILPILIYIIVCVASIFLPSSEGYDTILWKLLVGQVYAIPSLIITILLMFFINENKK